MAAFNISVDDSSPLISYTGAWTDTPLGDPLAQSYLAHSYHTTSTKGATATFTFNGTGIWLYGGKRPNYGAFNLTVDGRTVAEGKASGSNNAIGQLLGGARSLGMSEHTAVLTIAGTGPVDLDNLIFETHIGSEPGLMNQTRLDDSDPRIHYLPNPTSWRADSNQMFSNGTVHFSSEIGDRASILFTGDAVAVYGGSSFDHGDYTVSVGGHLRHLNGGSKGSVATYHPQTLLFFATNLGTSSHNLTIRNHGSSDAKFLDIDSIVVYGTNGSGSVSGSPANTHVSTTSTTSSGQKVVSIGGNGNSVAHNGSLPVLRVPSKAVIIGVVMTSILSFCVVIAMIYLCCCRRRKDAKSSSSSDGEPDLDLEAAKDGPYPGHITPFDPDTICQFYIGSPPPPSPEDFRKPRMMVDTPVYIGSRYSGGLPAEHYEEHYPDHARWSVATFDSTAATLKVEEPPKFTFPGPMPMPTPPPQTGKTENSMYSESDMDFADYYQQALTPQRPEHTLDLEHDYERDTSKESPPKPPGIEKNFRGSTYDFERL